MTNSRPRLLYVDDEAANISVMELRLGDHYDIVGASSDREACALLRSEGNRLALVLLDIQLVGGELDGIALARLIRGKLPANQRPSWAANLPAMANLPIIFVTAFGEQHDLPTLQAAGASAVVSKPVDFIKLSSAITRHHLRQVLGS